MIAAVSEDSASVSFLTSIFPVSCFCQRPEAVAEERQKMQTITGATPQIPLLPLLFAVPTILPSGISPAQLMLHTAISIPLLPMNSLL